MNETPMNPQTKKWAKIFVVGLVVILIIIILVSLSGKKQNNVSSGSTSGELTDAEKQEFLDQLAQYESEREPVPELTDAEKQEFLNQFQTI